MNVLVGLIKLYQLTLSPDHGPLRFLFPNGVCRYEPTCSEYTKQAVSQDGLKGLAKGIKRVASCHPLGGSGYDPYIKTNL